VTRTRIDPHGGSKLLIQAVTNKKQTGAMRVSGNHERPSRIKTMVAPNQKVMTEMTERKSNQMAFIVCTFQETY
jgi:hypothetical protein